MPVVSRNFGRLDAIPLTDRRIMREVGLLARERIIRRTRQGQSVTGRPFRPYTAAYRAQKAKELKRVARVDLTLSGSMLNDVTLTEVTPTTVEIGFKR